MAWLCVGLIGEMELPVFLRGHIDCAYAVWLSYFRSLGRDIPKERAKVAM